MTEFRRSVPEKRKMVARQGWVSTVMARVITLATTEDTEVSNDMNPITIPPRPPVPPWWRASASVLAALDASP